MMKRSQATAAERKFVNGPGRGQALDLHPLLGGLRRDRRSPERRLDRPGAGLRLAVQPRRALRQGRLGARARPRRAPPEVPDEAGRRQVAAGVLGRRRSTRSATSCSGHPRAARPRFGVLAGLGQVQQRAGLPVSQVRRHVGHEQRRPPGAHLSLDDRRRRGQHLGLRRDDQLLQRHAQLQVRCSSSAATPPRRIRSRCSTSCAARRTAPSSSWSIRASRAPRRTPTSSCACVPAPTCR